MTTTRVGVFESVAGSTAFLGDLIPHAAFVFVTSVEVSSVGVVGFTSRLAAGSGVGFSGVPFAHGVGKATLFIFMDGVSQAGVGTLTRSRMPLAGEVSTAGFSFLVLVDAASDAAGVDLVVAAHGSSQAGGFVQQRAETSTGGGVGVPLAVKLGVTREFSVGTVAADLVTSTVDFSNRAVLSPSAHVVASTLSTEVSSTCDEASIEGIRVFTLLVGAARRRAHASNVVPLAPGVGVAGSLLSVLVGACLDATDGLESGRIAFVAESTLIPFGALIRSLAEVATRAADEAGFIERATIDGEAGSTRFDEVAGSGTRFGLGVPNTGGVSRAVDGVKVAETALLDASFVVSVPFANSTSVFASSLLSLEFTRSTADLAIPNTAVIEITSLAAEPLRFTAGDAVVGFNVPDAGRVDVAFFHGRVLGVTEVGSSVAVAVVLALGFNVVPHAGGVGGTFFSVEVGVVALLLADGSSGVPFTHGRTFAGSLGGESAAAFRADATLRVPFTSRGFITVDLAEVLDFAGAAARLFRDETPRTFGFFVAAALVDTVFLSDGATFSTALRTFGGFGATLEFGRPFAVAVGNTSSRGGEATTRELARVGSSRPFAINIIASSLSGVTERALLVAVESERREVTIRIGDALVEVVDNVRTLLSASTEVRLVVALEVGRALGLSTEA